MPAKYPLKFTRAKSPAQRLGPGALSESPNRPSRSHSHDVAPRRQTPGPSGHPLSPRKSTSHSKSGSHERHEKSSPQRHERHHRRDSSDSPQGRHSRPDDDDDDDDDDDRNKDNGRGDHERGRRHSSFVPDKDQAKARPSSVEYRSPPTLRPRQPSADQTRALTPDKYLPDKYKTKSHDSPNQRPGRLATCDNARSKRTAASHSRSPSQSALFNKIPAALATYAGLQSVSKNADTAKDWIVWLQGLSETPQEIQELSAKATTTRDTLNQVQQTIKARPDLVEGEQGKQLKSQIEVAIESIDKELGVMTKLLSEISKNGADNGSVVNGLQDFWRSYLYKNEYKEKVKKAEEDMERELVELSTLMVNIYSRALLKPAPPGSAPVPPPAPTNSAKMLDSGFTNSANTTEQSTPEAVFTTHRATLDTSTDKRRPSVRIMEPGSTTERPTDFTSDDGQEEFSHPPSPDAVGREEAALGSPPSPSTPSVTASEEANVGSPRSASALGREKSNSDSSSNNNLTSKSGPHDAKSFQLKAHQQGSVKSEKLAEEALLDAAWDGDLNGTKQALKNASIRCTDDHGLTALHLACERDNLAIAIFLLDHGGQIHTRSSGGRTPLHLASRTATSTTVELLLERGHADPNATTAKGRTALHYAASKAVDGDDERREVLRVLRDWGADPTVKDRDGETARDVAQARGFWDAAATLRRAERKWEGEHGNWLKRHGFMK